MTGLVAHWKLDGNAGDYSGGGNNGTIVGATATADRFGIANAALSFNGTSSDYVDTSFDYSIQYNGKSTFTLWFKPFTINTSGKIKVLIGKVVPNYNISQLNAGIDIHQWG